MLLPRPAPRLFRHAIFRHRFFRHGLFRHSSPTSSEPRVGGRLFVAGPISEIAIAFFCWYGWSPVAVGAGAPEHRWSTPRRKIFRHAILISLDNSAFFPLFPQTNPPFRAASARPPPARSCPR